MDNEFAKSEIDYITRYQQAGYSDQYDIEDGLLKNLNNKKRYTPENVMIIKEHRYEGMSNPSDMSLLYVIETSDGTKGTILANYSPTGSTSINDFMKVIPKENVRDENVLPQDADK